MKYKMSLIEFDVAIDALQKKISDALHFDEIRAVLRNHMKANTAFMVVKDIGITACTLYRFLNGKRGTSTTSIVKIMHYMEKEGLYNVN